MVGCSWDDRRESRQRKMLNCDIVSVEASAHLLGGAGNRMAFGVSEVGYNGKLICHWMWVSLGET